MIWELHLGIFHTFTTARMCGQHSGRMSRVGLGGFISMSLVFYILNIFFLLFLIGKFNCFHGWGVPPNIRGKFGGNN